MKVVEWIGFSCWESEWLADAVSTNLTPGGIVGGDEVADANADAVGGVTHQPILRFDADGFAEEVAVFLVVNING